MKPHPRIRKTVKWGGAAVSVLLLVTWIGSVWALLHWGSGRATEVTVWAGSASVAIETGTPSSRSSVKGWTLERVRFQPLRWGFRRTLSWADPPRPPPRPRTYLHEYDVALWPLPLAALLITAIAWRLDTLARRRATLNLCPTCHYDRTGLAPSAVCPECGTPPGDKLPT